MAQLSLYVGIDLLALLPLGQSLFHVDTKTLLNLNSDGFLIFSSPRISFVKIEWVVDKSCSCCSLFSSFSSSVSVDVLSVVVITLT